MNKLYAFIFLLLPITALATHNRGGEITYRHLFGFTYEFTISTCTRDADNGAVDRPELEISFGDGDKESVQRTSRTPVQGYDAQKNKYVITHTYSGPGSYFICVSDPNRNAGIINLGGQQSENVSFAIQTNLIIPVFIAGDNNSVTFDECPCPELACAGFPYCYNPNAVDPDGDSLAYELIEPFDDNCAPLPLGITYTYPNAHGGSISLDPLTGDFCWNNPSMIGEFNIAIRITEYRNGVKIGFVVRDVQITVISGCQNTPPVIDPIPDTCVLAGDSIRFPVNASDADGDVVTLSGAGLPFSLGVNPASFPSVTGTGSVAQTFNWTTDCSHIRAANYQVFFRAEDNGFPELSSTTSMNIKVIPPRVTGITTNPLGNTVTVGWDASACSSVEGYRIYRSINPGVLPVDNCCYNVDLSNFGFDLIQTISDPQSTSYVDNDNLAIGNNFCYVVTGLYDNGQLESCPSDTSCTTLRQDVPILTHVTVNSTNAVSGEDSIMWAKPRELDTASFLGPYLYKVYQSNGFTGANTLVHTSPSANFISLVDTIFVHNGIDTESDANNYFIELYRIVGGQEELIGSSNTGSSIFLSSSPRDNGVNLTWTERVPWLNSSYEVYRADDFTGPYSLIGTTSVQAFTDSNLLNGEDYCYYVRSRGSYSISGIVNPILNRSQITCEIPTDLTPPCPPALTIEPDCEGMESRLTWNNPNNNCADDVTRYNVYFSSSEGGEFEVVGTVNSATDTTFTWSRNGSIAGCYYVTALDSIQYNNESDSSNVICVDNCPIYFLPNVFTPNGDGKNDLFIPLLPYKYIQDIDLVIYNRWGQEMFRTTDPMIRWDGINTATGAPVKDGVYYYICVVNTIRLSGIEPIELEGAFHVVRGNGNPN